MSFEEAYENYLIYARKWHKKQTFNVLQYNFNANIFSFFKGKLLDEINIDLIEEWKNSIFKKNFCNNHNQNLFSMLTEFLDYCHHKYSYDNSILFDIKPFEERIEKKKVDFYSLKEFRCFIKCFDNNIYKQFFNFMFFTGVRPGEAMALKFTDLEDDYIIINKTMDEHGTREVGTPKTTSSNRTIKIDRKLRKDLLKLKEFYIAKYCDVTFDYFIFGGKKPLAPTTINRYKLKACEKAKIRPITLHQFRHSHATMLLNKKIDIHVISSRLGHSNVSTTIDVYTHASIKQEKRVLSTLNSIRFNFSVLQYIFKK